MFMSITRSQKQNNYRKNIKYLRKINNRLHTLITDYILQLIIFILLQVIINNRLYKWNLKYINFFLCLAQLPEGLPDTSLFLTQTLLYILYFHGFSGNHIHKHIQLNTDYIFYNIFLFILKYSQVSFLWTQPTFIFIIIYINTAC